MRRVCAAVLLLMLAAASARAADGPGRIVSIGGAVTETVYALGAADRLVAVDSTSRYPEAARSLPDVGYMRRLSAEPILSLAPDLILAVEDAGPPGALQQLRGSGVPVVTIPDEASPEGVVEKVTAVAEAIGLAERGAALADDLREDFALLQRRLAAVTRRPTVLFLLSVGRGAPMAAGRDTAAAGVIDLAAGRNAVDGFTGYEPLSPEAAVALSPDVVLVTDQTLQALGGREGVLNRQEIAGTPAGRNGRVVAMDALLLLGFGPRTPAAIRALATALHPDIGLPEPPAR